MDCFKDCFKELHSEGLYNRPEKLALSRAPGQDVVSEVAPVVNVSGGIIERDGNEHSAAVRRQSDSHLCRAPPHHLREVPCREARFH